MNGRPTTQTERGGPAGRPGPAAAAAEYRQLTDDRAQRYAALVALVIAPGLGTMRQRARAILAAQLGQLAALRALGYWRMPPLPPPAGPTLAP